MSGAGFLRIAKPTGAGIVLAAARHNKRAIQAEAGSGGSIDPALSSLNYRLAGPEFPEGVAEMASSRMKAAGLGKLRKNAVRAIELVFSLPVDAAIDHRAYFSDCMRWAGDRFGGPENVLSADVHLDESAPHCHVLILPLSGGRMVGSDMVGGPKVLAGHLTSFHEAVAGRHGLRRAPARLSTSDRRSTAAAVLQRLRETADPALRSAVWAAVRDAIDRDPVPWASVLGLAIGGRPAKPLKSMAAIFTSPGKGPKREPDERSHIGFVDAQDHRTICSVGFGQESTLDTRRRVTPDQLGAEGQEGSPRQRPGDLPSGLLGSRPPVSTPVSRLVNTKSPRKAAAVPQAAGPVQPTVIAPASTSGVLERQADRDEGELTRLRESGRAVGLWCEERGEIVDAPLPAGRPARLAAESRVANQLAGVR
jgi:Plasmid recombination enzyme